MHRSPSARVLLSTATIAAVLFPATAAQAATAPHEIAATAAAKTKTLSFRGMSLKIPAGWRVYRNVPNAEGDRVRVVTGTCPREMTDNIFRCDSFDLYGPKWIARAHAGEPYDARRPFHPGTGVAPCPTRLDAVLKYRSGKPSATGQRPVGRGHEARYRAYDGVCSPAGGRKVVATFTQREWHLAKQRILVVDVWDTPGLATVLRNATWR
ncbi:hypothetical protein Misp01_16340 [Microtetraspora sp. NBRC 13810]|uniref:hypothetical protein n=1 Tax=Microtetraspora sp. NBRC 13810 TaxID=3030990 RepID=UPI0024A4A5CD|nr:hypothetical protein [Microtetraspora sp. NBRC 13810]GLW06504.1 hypothetical protein Misp01_16340 [Microtetraspora sp. NBRC 13810]